MISKWQALGSEKGPKKGVAAARKMANIWMRKAFGRDLQVCVCVCVGKALGHKLQVSLEAR
jgi:hypothetical protein